jgi:hypothetical protein
MLEFLNFKIENMKNILMIVYNYLPMDPRVRREATALIEQGYSVDIICLRAEGQKKFELFENIKIFRINLKKERSGKKK